MYTSLILYEGKFFSNFKYSCFLSIEMMIIMCLTLYRILLRISGMVFVQIIKLFVLLSIHSVYFHSSALLTEQWKHSEESDKHFFKLGGFA